MAKGMTLRRDWLILLNESRVWLKIITKTTLLPEDKLASINQECDELCRIINASLKTTLTNRVR